MPGGPQRESQGQLLGKVRYLSQQRSKNKATRSWMEPDWPKIKARDPATEVEKA